MDEAMQATDRCGEHACTVRTYTITGANPRASAAVLWLWGRAASWMRRWHGTASSATGLALLVAVDRVFASETKPKSWAVSACLRVRGLWICTDSEATKAALSLLPASSRRLHLSLSRGD